MIVQLLAVSELTDFAFRLMVIPLSLYMIYSGYIGARDQRVLLHHRLGELTNGKARVAGILKILLGIVFLVVTISTFFRAE